MPVLVQFLQSYCMVNPKSVSGQSGLKSGDGIIEICGENVQCWSHERAKAAMVRAGNEIDFVVQSSLAQKLPVAYRKGNISPKVKQEMTSAPLLVFADNCKPCVVYGQVIPV